jgi:protein-disulfide isomerase
LKTTSLFFFFLLAAMASGCHAQQDASTTTTSAAQKELDRRIEVRIRNEFNVPPDYSVTTGKREKSDISGFDALPVTFSNGAHQKVMDFLISKDNKTLARLERFNLEHGPLDGVSLQGRPVRGPANAPVTIVNFDDLECPFCTRMHEELFPATQERYKGQVRFIYKDYPLVEIHPWAMHAAVDVNCLAAQSQKGYWALVDHIHGHEDEINGESGKADLKGAMLRLDQLTREEGKQEGVDMAKLDACIAKQDESAVSASMMEGMQVGVDGTPTLFINGERTTGAIPQNVLWGIIDRAIKDAGGTPPPGPAAAPAGPSASSAPATPAK